MKLIDEMLTDPPPQVSGDLILKLLTPVLSQFPFSILIWNLGKGTLTQFKQKHNTMSENVPIQLIIAPRGESGGGGSAGMPKHSASQFGTVSERASTASTSASFSEQESEEEEVVFRSVAPPESPVPPRPAEATEMLLVSPGFDMYERLLEARRVADNSELWFFKWLSNETARLLSGLEYCFLL